MGNFNYDATISVVAAICGNWYAESGLNPNVFEGHVSHTYSEMLSTSLSGGYGLGQWTTTSSGSVNRRVPLLKWLKSNGYNYYSGSGQCKYFVYENSWVNNTGNYDSLDEFLCSDSNSLEDLTIDFLKCWEIPADSGTDVQQVRLGYAENAYALIEDTFSSISDEEWEEYYSYEITDSDWSYSDDTSGYINDLQVLTNELLIALILSKNISSHKSKTNSFASSAMWMLKPTYKKIPQLYNRRARRR